MLDFVLDFLQPLAAALLRLLGLLDLLVELLALLLKLAHLFGQSVVGGALQTRPNILQLVNLQLVLRIKKPRELLHKRFYIFFLRTTFL